MTDDRESYNSTVDMLAPSPAPGQRLGEYELLDEVGAGGFSIVWRARHTASGRIVALKLPRVADFIAYLRREAAISSRLQDPHVVGIEEVHVDQDPPFLVMPYIEGANLPLPDAPPEPKQVLRAFLVFSKIVEVVERLHLAEIVHGDLKPGNVRVDSRGVFHVLDLGLARVQVSARQASTLRASVRSVTGQGIAGTLDYMAPEVMAGEKPGKAADVYALGVILHHLLCGRPPAFGVSPRELNPYMPPGTSDFLRQMLHPDPARRLPDAGYLRPVVEGFSRAEERCCRRRNGHQRRLVFRERMHTLARGARVLLWSALAICCAVFGWPLFLEALHVPSRTVEPFVVLLFGAGFLLFWFVLLLGITTINAWILGIPEKSYKNRRGHPLWTFMMQ